jgi:hypothetical protein
MRSEVFIGGGRERFCSCVGHAFPCTQEGERERERGAFFSGQKEGMT